MYVSPDPRVVDLGGLPDHVVPVVRQQGHEAPHNRTLQLVAAASDLGIPTRGQVTLQTSSLFKLSYVHRIRITKCHVGMCNHVATRTRV